MDNVMVIVNTENDIHLKSILYCVHNFGYKKKNY